MASKSSATTRNVAFCGHSNSGKTTLVESLLFTGGAIPRKGSADEGTTVTDYDAEEKERKHSIDLACAYFETEGQLVNVLDTPGYGDFIGQVYSAVPAVECVVVVVDADEGVRPNTRKVWEIAEAMKLPCIVVINRLDRDQAKPEEALKQVQEQLSAKCIPLNLPDGAGPGFSAVEVTLGNKAGSDDAKATAANLLETVVESNDALMERYLEGEELSDEEVQAQLKDALANRAVFPVLHTSAEKDIGVPELMDAILECAPSGAQAIGRMVHAPDTPKETFPLKTGLDDPFCAQVFRVVSDPYVGKLSFLRIFSGSLSHNEPFLNPQTGRQEKVGKLVRVQGKEQESVETAGAGQIVALLKLEGLKAYDILTFDKPLVLDPPALPTPMYSRAVEPKAKADEKKFAEAIPKIIDEDVMVQAKRDRRTHEMVVSGISQLHLSTLWDRLKSRYGVEVTTKEPKTPYLETVTAQGDDHYRHKKQTGGAGEFAEVWLRVEPRERGEGVEFVSSVFGGAISASYVSSVEKGIRAVLDRGVIAGCPVVDVKVDVYDGKEHPVDSKDVAFQKAGREAFKRAVKQAKPVLLEPIVDLEVSFPVENMGDIQGDLNRRRARVIGMDSVGEFQTLKAQVPLAEIADYASSLGSVTGGQGSYGIEMSHYENVPSNIQQKVCDAAKADLEKDE
jgi:elongation factor G